jgi:signal peptidase I
VPRSTSSALTDTPAPAAEGRVAQREIHTTSSFQALSGEFEAEAAEPQPYVFRPAEFRPAVFIPAEPPHRAPAAEAAPIAAPMAPPPAAAPHRSFSASLTRIGEELVAWFKTLVSAAVYATLIVTFGFQVARVEGQSMVPTLEDQDRLIVNKLAYRIGSPRVGDIVMLYYPEDPEKSFVKRVVAEEGDTIRSTNGRVFRNEVPLDDAYIPEEYRSYDTWGPVVVRRGYYFVMGDHRNNSSDSRTWGEVPKKYIIGRVQVRWWPVNHARIF